MKRGKGIKRWELWASILFAGIALLFLSGIIYIIISKIIFGTN